MALDTAQNRQVVVELMKWGMNMRRDNGWKLGTIQDYVYLALAPGPIVGRVQNAGEKQGPSTDMVGEWHPNVKRLLEGADHEFSGSCENAVE